MLCRRCFAPRIAGTGGLIRQGSDKKPGGPMQQFVPFEMERWQSIYENHVDYNLSESGVHPLRLNELLDIGGATSLGDTHLGYGQSNGSEPLRGQIASLYGSTTAAGIVVTNGSAEANYVALWELVGPGDEVAILVPAYMQTYGLALNIGARVVEIPMLERNGWQPDPDDIRRLVTDRTRVIVVTNPGNPTGVVLGTEARDAVIDAAERSGAWILADEVYAGAELAGPETPSFFGLHPRVIATGSLSKSYGLPGLRIGWLITEDAMAAKLWARRDYTTISPGELTDRLARVALDRTIRPRLLQRTRSIIRTGVDVLESWMTTQGCFTWTRPDAGAIVFARYDFPVPSAVLAQRLRVENSVLVVPGSQFGCESHIRFGIGIHNDLLKTALERIETTIISARSGSL
jgi:aspartate/methionine/tyrosine aminotransferase